MSMAADSNMNFGVFPPSVYNNHVVSFQSPPEVVQNNLSGGVVLGRDAFASLPSSSSSMMMRMIPPLGSYHANLLTEPLPCLKHDTGLAVDWSYNEHAILNDALIKFADEPGVMKYIKIAALLPDKTVRDVALRSRWMNKSENVRRRRIEDNYVAKKIPYWKEKKSASSARANIHPVQPGNLPAYSFMFHPANNNNQFSFEAPIIDGATQRLLEENFRVFNQISDNLSSYKLQDNVKLFSQTRKNIRTVLNSMSLTPGIMSQMPPLPVSLDEDLMNYILPLTSQAHQFGTPNCMSMKQELS